MPLNSYIHQALSSVAKNPPTARPSAPQSLRFHKRAALHRALRHVEVEQADMVERPEIRIRHPGSPYQRQFPLPGIGKTEDRNEIAQSAERPAKSWEKLDRLAGQVEIPQAS